MDKPTVLFAGTPEFGLASLKALVEAGIAPRAVLTQPDRPSGRGKIMTASPVKHYAARQGIDVLQPQTASDRDTVRTLETYAPDILVVAAYGLLLPQTVLDIPRAGCLNVHASLLPRWRGAAPVQAAILAGDKETGVSLMSMTAGLDCGPVYASESVTIGDAETAGDLHDRLAILGGELLVRKFTTILDGELEAVPQNDAAATYRGKISKQDARIDWTKTATILERHIRAYNPVPGAWFMHQDSMVKCWQASIVEGTGDAPATISASDRSGIKVSCGERALLLETVQLPGKGRISGREFASQLSRSGGCFD